MRSLFLVALFIGSLLLGGSYWGLTRVSQNDVDLRIVLRSKRESVPPFATSFPASSPAVEYGHGRSVGMIKGTVVRGETPTRLPSPARVHLERSDTIPTPSPVSLLQKHMSPSVSSAGETCEDLLLKVVTSRKKAFRVLRPCPSPFVGATLGYLDRLPSANTTRLHRWERSGVELVRVYDLVYVSTMAMPGGAAMVLGAYSDAEGPHLRAVPISMKNRDDILEQSLPYVECPEVAGPVDTRNVPEYINFNNLAVTLGRRIPVHNSNAFLCGGTLLDWERHCGMGINTDDIDYCMADTINSTELEKQYISAPAGHPLEILSVYPALDHCRMDHTPPVGPLTEDCGSITAGAEVVLGLSKSIRADYFVMGNYSPFNDRIWWSLLWRNDTYGKMQCYPASEIAYSLFNGQFLVKVPVKSALWHRWNYGKTWRMDKVDGKKVKWDWWSSPLNFCGEMFREPSGTIRMHWDLEKVNEMLTWTP